LYQNPVARYFLLGDYMNCISDMKIFLIDFEPYSPVYIYRRVCKVEFVDGKLIHQMPCRNESCPMHNKPEEIEKDANPDPSEKAEQSLAPPVSLFDRCVGRRWEWNSATGRHVST
jgi:hypothetical protein